MKQDVKIYSTNDFKELNWFFSKNIQWTSQQGIHFIKISTLAELKN